MNSEFTVSWSVPRAFKTDRIGMPWTLLSYEQCAVIHALYQCHLQRSFPSMAKATSPVLTTGRLRQKDLQKWRFIIHRSMIIMNICHFYAYTNWLRNFFLPMMQAPGLPGEYEVRYSPNSLRGSNTGMRGNTYIAVARFTVDTVWNQKKLE